MHGNKLKGNVFKTQHFSLSNNKKYYLNITTEEGTITSTLEFEELQFPCKERLSCSVVR